MKLKEKIEAIKLRSINGLPINKIAEQLNVSKSTIFEWTKNINLTEDQIYNLKNSNAKFEAQQKAAINNKLKFKNLRHEYQIQGRELSKTNSKFRNICMLYWGEGNKVGNTVSFSNSDSNMMKYFKDNLQQSLNIEDSKISLYIQCYDNNGKLISEIEQFWLDTLSLTSSNLRKTRINQIPKSSQGKKIGKQLYGCCNLRVNSVKYLQMIFGGIQEISGLDNLTWIR